LSLNDLLAAVITDIAALIADRTKVLSLHYGNSDGGWRAVRSECRFPRPSK